MARATNPSPPRAVTPKSTVRPVFCMFCGTKLSDEGEGYYDHLRQSKTCESNWRTWRENLLNDHPGGD